MHRSLPIAKLAVRDDRASGCATPPVSTTVRSSYAIARDPLATGEAHRLMERAPYYSHQVLNEAPYYWATGVWLARVGWERRRPA